MRSSFHRWLIFALLVLVPAQSALAGGGMLCATMPRAQGVSATDASSPPSAHAHHVDSDNQAMHHAADGNDDPQRASCSACAPCTGSLALPSVANLGATEVASGDDFLPVVVDLRPARSDGLERPPRTI